MTKSIVIIGAGSGGSYLASKLKGLKKLDATITIINPYSFSVFKVVALRGAVLGGKHISNSMVPLQNSADIVEIGFAESIDPEAKEVKLRDEKVIKYDYLVVATGSQAAGPAGVPQTVGKTKGVIKFFQSIQESIKTSKKIVIIGGGPVGLELAGEIRDAYGDKSITVLQRSKDETLCPATPPLTNKFQRTMKAKLKKLNIDVIFSEATDISRDDFENGASLAGERKLHLKNGQEIETDLVFWCVGIKLNNSMMPQKWLNEKGQVKVEPTLKVVGENDVFAIGDINDVNETKMSFFAQYQADVVTKNLLLMVDGKDGNKVYKANTKQIMMVSLGPSKGVANLMGITLGDFFCKRLKSNFGYLGKYWNDISKLKHNVELDDRSKVGYQDLGWEEASTLNKQ